MSINLLPQETREDLLYARRNTHLRKCISLILLGIAGIGLVVVLGLSYINQNTKRVEQENEKAAQSLRDQNLVETQKKVESLSDSFKLVVQVLSRQVLFSKVLEQTGRVMPNGTALAGLNINEFQGGLDLQAKATNYQTASQVAVNLEDPNNQLFQRVDIQDINCSDETEGIYKCTGRYRALFSEENPFTFLGEPDSGGAQ